jgi:hypothetical protein
MYLDFLSFPCLDLPSCFVEGTVQALEGGSKMRLFQLLQFDVSTMSLTEDEDSAFVDLEIRTGVR